MAHHEQGVIDAFNNYFRSQARAHGRDAHTVPLGGQDALVGGDYVITDRTQFALVEFKFTEKQLVAEAKKNLRLAMCKELENNLEMRALHDKCHFIAWSQLPSRVGVLCNIYRLEICNKKIFGVFCGLSAVSAMAAAISARQFTTEFIANNPPRSITVEEFEKYLSLLLSLAGSDKKSVELVMADDADSDCRLFKFPSIRAAYKWMQALPRRPGTPEMGI